MVCSNKNWSGINHLNNVINKSPLGKYTRVFYYEGSFQKVISQGKNKNAELVVYFRGDWLFSWWPVINKQSLPVHKSWSLFNPLHHNISMHTLCTVLHTLPKVLNKRICLMINSFFSWWSFSFILVTLMCDSGVIL